MVFGHPFAPCSFAQSSIAALYLRVELNSIEHCFREEKPLLTGERQSLGKSQKLASTCANDRLSGRRAYSSREKAGSALASQQS